MNFAGPHEILRNGTVAADSGGTIGVESSVRMGFDAPVVLLRLTLKNDASTEERTSLSMRLPLEIQWTEPVGWEWGHDGPVTGDDTVYKPVISGSTGHQTVRSCDTRTLEPVLFLEDCDGSDPRQQWTGDSLAHAGSGLSSNIRNVGTGACISDVIVHGILPITKCGASSALFEYVNNTVRRKPAADSPAGTPYLCLDAIHGFKFTDLGEYGCHYSRDVITPDASSQHFRYDPDTKLLVNGETGQCVVPSKHAPKRACAGVGFARPTEDDPGFVSCALSVDTDGIASALCDNVTIPAHGDVTLGIVLTGGLDGVSTPVDEGAGQIAANFSAAFAKSASDMEAWWASAFVPNHSGKPIGPGEFSGNFPTLETNDTALSYAYYGGLLSFMVMSQRVKATTTEQSWNAFRSVGPTAGVTALYMWDVSTITILCTRFLVISLTYCLL